jgi:hypothetical protein
MFRKENAPRKTHLSIIGTTKAIRSPRIMHWIDPAHFADILKPGHTVTEAMVAVGEAGNGRVGSGHADRRWRLQTAGTDCGSAMRGIAASIAEVEFPAFAADDFDDDRFSFDLDAPDSDRAGRGDHFVGFAFGEGASVDHGESVVTSAGEAVQDDC